MCCLLGHRPVPLFAPTGDEKCYRLGVWCCRCWKEMDLHENIHRAISGLTRWGVSGYHQGLLRDCIETRT